MTIREELIKVSKLKRDKDQTKSEYHSSVVYYVINVLPETKWDAMTAEAQRYINACIDAFNKSEALPKFPDEETPEETPKKEEKAVKKDQDEEGQQEQTEDEEPSKKKKKDKKKKKKDKKSKTKNELKPKSETTKTEDKKVAKADKKTTTKGKKAAPDKDKKAAPNKGKKAAPDKDKKKAAPKKDPVALDKFGLRVGSKRSIAAAMFLKGCKMSDVKETTGNSTYNLLKDLEKMGHNHTKKKGVITLKFNKSAKADNTKADKK